MLGRSAMFRPSDFILVAEPQHVAIGHADALEQMIQHHESSQRRQKRGDEQAVIAARHPPATVPDA